MDISTLSGLLASLLLPVGAISWFISHFLDNLDAWKNLPAATKSAAILVASLIVGGVAYAILHTVPGTVLDQLQPIYALIYAIIAAWIGGQVQHNNQVAREDRKELRTAEIIKVKSESEAIITGVGAPDKQYTANVNFPADTIKTTGSPSPEMLRQAAEDNATFEFDAKPEVEGVG